MKRLSIVVATTLFVFSLFAGTAFAYKLFDLTHKFENGMPAWAGKWEGMSMWGGCKRDRKSVV